ncbi:MAG: SurA N-terminal domain-containing protein [Pseudomonadota bacterium]
MLTQVRSVLKGAVAWFFVVLLILAFSLFGVPQLQQFAGNSAITVGSKRFSPQYVQNEFNRVVQIQRIESGGQFTREDALASGLPQQIIDSIATTAAIDQFAEKMKLVTPRPVVRDYLQTNENFQNPATGKFDRMVLESALQRFNMTPEAFEERISEDLQRQQLVESLATNAAAPKALAELTLMRETERRKISYIVVTDEMSGAPAEPTPEELQSYYNANSAAFTAPEYRTFDVLSLRSADFREGAEVSEEELQRLYDLNRERLYEVPERRTIYQLTYDTETEAQAAIGSLQQGVSFEKIADAKGFSLDDVTFADAQQRDILDPGVAEAAFADDISEGAVVGPVQGLFGWTIAQIAGVTPPEITTFEEARDDIESEYLAQDTRRAMLDAIDEIEEVRDTGAGLAAAAEAAGYDLQSFGPVDRFSFAPGGAIVNDIPGAVLEEAFRLEEDQESEALELTDDDGYFFVAMRTVREPALIPYEDVADEVADRWRKDERTQRIAATAKRIEETLAGGATLEEAASEFDIKPTTIIVDRRFTNESIDQALNQKIFEAAPDANVSGKAALGEAELIAHIDIVAVSPTVAPPDQAEFFERYLGYQLDQELVEAFLKSIRDDYNVKVNQAQLDLLFGGQE